MGWTSGLKLRRVLEHAATVIAVEALCAAQALDLRRPLETARGTGAALDALRGRVPFLEEDRDLSRDIEAATALIADGSLVGAVEAVVGPLR
jgi:histidine ammonia-lyase